MPETGKPLRHGWTTGACAAAAAAAAYRALATGVFPDAVEIVLPRGERPVFALATKSLAAGAATAGVVKDAGDDPDVTHGAEVLATVAPGEPGSGIAVTGGAGVGTVTLPGIPVPVGEAAINPGPRRIIAAAVLRAMDETGGPRDVTVTVSIPGGEKLAEQTLNPRLGITGGLSVLGTTGVVVPFSCEAWVQTVHRAVQVAAANGLTHIAGSTGYASERAAQRFYGLPEVALIDMGDFVGGLLKYLRAHPLPRLTLAGGFAKFAKLAEGHLNVHSGASRVDFAALAAQVERLGGAPAVVAAARAANTAMQVLELADAANLPLADAVAARCLAVARQILKPQTAVDVLIVDRSGEVVGHAGP
ncbi:cobalt-precorrin-5B (C(1))-methyltransferase [Oleispirillum naphthae]|uniref:cobalt-precorrin-5B (C(1))-methyltransferase n=1 Tax=Oleispirillum naphthae TaxID=2838853 RepID=UPI003082688B